MSVRASLLPLIVALTTGSLGLAACGSDGGTGMGGGSASSASGSGGAASGAGGATSSTSSAGGGAPTTTDVTITFEARVGDKVFSCADTYDGLGTASTQVNLVDFRFYVHDVRLLKAGGGEVPVTLKQDGLWQYQDVALLDFEDKKGGCSNGTAETNHVVSGTVPAGTIYDGIAFKLGLPESLNHGDVATAPSPLNLSGLFWIWQYGYKFLRVDAAPTQPGLTAFNMHLGSTGCTGDPAMGEKVVCSNLNVPEVSLSGFHADQNKIVLDYAALVSTTDLSKNAGGAPGCMSDDTDPECQSVFPKLGLDLATGKPAGNQAIFAVE